MAELKHLIQEAGTIVEIRELEAKGIKSLSEKCVIEHYTSFYDETTENYKSVIFYYE